MSAINFPYPFSALVIRGGSLIARFWDSRNTPIIRGQLLREAIAYCQPGWTDKLIIAPGAYDLTPTTTYPTGVLWPNEVTIQGSGRRATHLYGTINSDQQGAMFTCQNNDISHLTMEAIAAGSSTGTVFQQSDPRVLGFDFPGSGTLVSSLVTKAPFRTRVSHCDLKGPAWGVFSWSDMNAFGGAGSGNGIANFLTMEHCDIYSARHCVGGYSSGYGQDFRLYDCRMFGDADDVFSVGAISQMEAQSGVFGIVWMGGTLEAKRCTMRLKGRADYLDPDGGQSWSRTRRVCGITDSYGYEGSAPAANTTMTVQGLDCLIEPNGSDPEQCYDLDFKLDYVQKQARIAYPGCLGSATDGSDSLTKSW